MTTSPITTPFHLDRNYRPITSERTESELPVEGTIPEVLNGRYLRNGPNPRPGAPSTHWFYGDGMIHGVELSAGRARWYRNRWVRTNTFTDGATLLRSDGSVDRAAGLANTNVIAHAVTMPFRWDDNYGARIGLRPRHQPDAHVAWHQIEPCYGFHVLNAYDSDDGVVIDALRYPELWRTGPDQFGGATLHRWTLPC